MKTQEIIDYIRKDATDSDLSKISEAVKNRIISAEPSNEEIDIAYQGLQETLNTDDVYNGDISIVYSLGEGTNLIAIPSIIRDFNKQEDHDCIQPTIVSSAEDMTRKTNVHWVWDESSPTHVASKSVKIGQVRRGAAIHRLVPGMVVAFHSRQRKNGRHSGQDTKAFELYLDDGDIDMREVPLAWSELPLPSNMEDEN